MPTTAAYCCPPITGAFAALAPNTLRVHDVMSRGICKGPNPRLGFLVHILCRLVIAVGIEG